MQKIHNQNILKSDKQRWYLIVAVLFFIAGASFITSFLQTTSSSLLYCGRAVGDTTTDQMEALLHYATSRVTPQQSIGEIRVSVDVLQSIGPSNFLVFGLGHDSLMWASFNPRGKTLFLEEDPRWVQTVLKDARNLHADTVRYRTKLSEANELLRHYRIEPDCSPKKSFLRGNDKCRLALNMMSNEVYETEWDMIMVDAPRGYFAEAPGRMAAIYSAAVMAKNRKKPGLTHVFLHDVDRKVEKMYAEKFLCKKYLVKHVGRLWHFQIPSANNVTSGDEFC